MHAAQSFTQSSIVQHVLLGTPASTLRTGIKALEVQAFLFSRIEPLADDDVAELVPLLRRDRPLRFLRADGDQLDPSLGEDGYKLGLIGS